MYILFYGLIAWLAYRVTQKPVMDLTHELARSVGIFLWSLGTDILLGLIFVAAGTIIVPRGLRRITALVLLICYLFNYEGMRLLWHFLPFEDLDQAMSVLKTVSLATLAVSSIIAILVVFNHYKRNLSLINQF